MERFKNRKTGAIETPKHPDVIKYYREHPELFKPVVEKSVGVKAPAEAKPSEKKNVRRTNRKN